MHQKFVISRDGDSNILTIREYAVIEKKPKNAAALIMQKENYSLLCEETYESELIVSSISKGIKALVAIIRNHNIFPIEPYATKIAESVMALYNSSEENSVELFFDDIDLVTATA